MKYRFRCRSAALGLLCALLTPPVPADGIEDTAVAPQNYALEIHKAERLLLLKQGERVAKQYHIALGRGGAGDKRIRGDNKTPLGVYRITGFNDSSPYHLFMRLSYPNIKDGFFGLRNRLISRADFDRIVDALRTDATPPQNTPLGGAIGIHGLGDENAEKLKIHSSLDWTQGCIALTNREINELRHYVDVGTKVVIRE